MPWVVPVKLKVDFSRVIATPREEKEKKKGGIRKKFQGFASDMIEKTASIFSRHEMIEQTDVFVLQKRKRENSNKPPFRILIARKPVYCIAFSHDKVPAFT